jgi:ketosteroid isomerase-like protein
MKRLLALVALSTALAGCQTMQRELFTPRPTTTSATTISSTPVGPPMGAAQPGYQPFTATPQVQPTVSTPYVDSRAESLLDADRDFAAAARDRGFIQALAAVADPEATFLSARGAVVGADQVARVGLPANAGSMYWWPERATLASSGDFGQTSGRYALLMKGAPAIEGRYFTVWRKDTSSRWRIVSNAYLANPPAAPVAATRPAQRRR